MLDDHRPNSWICHLQPLSVYPAPAHHWLRAPGHSPLGASGCHSLRSTRTGAQRAPDAQGLHWQILPKDSQKYSWAGSVAVSILIHLCEQELRYLYSMTGSKQQALEESHWWFLLFANLLFIWMPFFFAKNALWPLLLPSKFLLYLVSLLYLAVLIFLSDIFCMFFLVKKNRAFISGKNRNIDLNEEFIKQTSSLKLKALVILLPLFSCIQTSLVTYLN